MEKVAVFNIGCKVNQYECDCIQAALESFGVCTTDKLEKADLYIINTCAVTKEAERKSRQILSRVKAINNSAPIVITGCASEKNKVYYEDRGVSIVTGVKDKLTLLELVKKTYFKDKSFDFTDDLNYDFRSRASSLDYEYEEICFRPLLQRTRAYVKIQEGCNNYCTYCLIPYLRGSSRSRKIAAIKREVAFLAGNIREIVITGINLSAFGLDTGESLTELFEELKDFPGRVRLGSFYAEAVTTSLISILLKMTNFCPHFHISLQSGSDKVLKDMNRNYDTTIFREKINLIRESFPNAAITTDVIAGYPTEGEADFLNSYKFIEQMEFSSLHVFPFSKREGTKAFLLKNLSSDIVNARKNKLIQLNKSLKEKYLKKMLKVEQNVVFENIYCNGLNSGYSEFYIKIYCKSQKNVARVRPIKIYEDGLLGEEIL